MTYNLFVVQLHELPWVFYSLSMLHSPPRPTFCCFTSTVIPNCVTKSFRSIRYKMNWFDREKSRGKGERPAQSSVWEQASISFGQQNNNSFTERIERNRKPHQSRSIGNEMKWMVAIWGNKYCWWCTPSPAAITIASTHNSYRYFVSILSIDVISSFFSELWPDFVWACAMCMEFFSSAVYLLLHIFCCFWIIFLLQSLVCQWCWGYRWVTIAALFWLLHLIGFRMGAIVHLDKLIFKYLCCTNSTQ